MNTKNPAKGYLFAFITTLAMATVYIFSKDALNNNSLPLFLFYWFGFALMWNVGYLFYRKKNKLWIDLYKNEFKLMMIVGSLELIGTIMFFYSINKISDPSVSSFFSNIGPIYIAILSVIFLRERFTIVETLGILVTFTGAVVINYGISSLKEIFEAGTGYMVTAYLIYSINTIIIKKNIDKLDPTILSLNRVLFLFTFGFIYLLVSGDSFAISTSSAITMIAGSFFGPFLSVIASYIAFQHIEATKYSLVQTTRSILVLVISYFYFGLMPVQHQLIGGFLTVVGVAIVALAKIRKKA